MKTFIYSLLFAGFLGCGSSTGNQERLTATASAEAPQERDVLVGSITREDLLEPPHKFWYDAQYKSYIPSKEALDVIRQNINKYDIKIYMGTWCADSQLEIPRFFNLLEQCNYDLVRVQMLGVEFDKTLPGGLKENYDIIRVPTIIFYEDGKEVNRFVEYPQKSLEDDIAQIVSGKKYRHSYSD